MRLGRARKYWCAISSNNESYKEAIAKVDPLNPTELGVNSIMQAIFGILHTPKGQTLVKKADPDAKPQAPDMSADQAPRRPARHTTESDAPGGQDIPPPQPPR